MKRFSKKFALMLVLAMIVGMFSGVVTASAANAPFTSQGFSFATSAGALSNGMTLRVAGKSETTAKQWYTVYKDGVKVNGSAEYTVVYTTDADGAAMLVLGTGKYNGLVRAVSVGTDASTRLTATIYDADGNKVTAISTAIYVRESAAAVAITTAVDEALEVGATLDLDATMSNAAGDTTAIENRKTYVTDYFQWTSSDEAIATVDQAGVVTAVAEGTATITVSTYVKSDFSGTATNSASVDVVVDNGVAQIVGTALSSATVIKVQFDGESAYTASNVALVFASNNVPIQVKSFAYDSADATVAYVTTYSAMTNGTSYKLTIGDLEAVTFTASIGEIASIVIDSTALQANGTRTVSFKVYDANGVDVTSSYSTGFSVVCSTAGSVTAAGTATVYMGAANTVTTLQLKYTKWNYTTGESTEIASNVASFTSVTDTVSSWAYTTAIAGAASATTAQDYSATAKTTLYVGNTGYIYSAFNNLLGSVSYQSDNTAVTGETILASVPTYTSLNNSVLAVSTTGFFTANAAGTATVMIVSGDVTYYVTFTVKAAAAVTSVSADKTSGAVSTTLAGDSVVVTLTAYDQYGSKIAYAPGTSAATLLDGTTAPVYSNVAFLENGSDAYTATFTFTAKSTTAGTDYVKLVWGSYSANVAITVKAPGVQTGYTVSTTSVDSYTTASTTFSVYSVDAAGTKLGVVTGATYTITNASGTNVTATYATGTISAAGVGTINTLTKAVGELPAGTYTIKVTVGTANYVYGTLTVTSTRPTLTVSVPATTVTALNNTTTFVIAGTTSAVTLGNVIGNVLSTGATSSAYIISVKATIAGDAYIYTLPVGITMTYTTGTVTAP